MAMNEAERFRLQQALARAIGDEPTETLMANLPPVPWTELATKSDLAHLGSELRSEMGLLRAELRGEMAELRGEMADLRGALRGELGQYQGETRGEFGAVRAEIAELRTAVNVGLAGVRIELHDQLRLNTWRLITAMGVFTAIMAAVTRLG